MSSGPASDRVELLEQHGLTLDAYSNGGTDGRAKREREREREGAENSVSYLNAVKAHAEDKGVTLCYEYLNSKVNHKDYIFDHIAWGVDVMTRVNSPRVTMNGRWQRTQRLS